MPRFHLYVDDSGSRYSDRPQAQRADGLDYFALGGVLIDESQVGTVLAQGDSTNRMWWLVTGWS